MMRRGFILLFMLILISSINAQSLDLNIELIPNVVITPPIYSHEHVIVHLNIINLDINSKDRYDIKLSYEIKDEDNNIIDARSSTIALQTSLSVSEIFSLPSNLKAGKYNVKVNVDAQDYHTLVSESFYIKKMNFAEKLNYLYYNSIISRIFKIFLFVLLILLIIAIFVVMRHYHIYHG